MTDRLEFESFYRTSRGFVLHKARRLLNNEADAMEVTQEVFLRAHASWDKIVRHPSPIGWLLTATTRLAIDRLRRQRTARSERARWRSSDASSDPRSALEASVLVSALLEEESKLTCLIVCHILVDGMTQEETAMVLDVSRKTVQRHLERFKLKCKALFPDPEKEPSHA